MIICHDVCLMSRCGGVACDIVIYNFNGVPANRQKTIGHGDEALRENTLNLLLSFSLGLYWLMSFLKQKIGLTMSLWPVRNFKPSSHVSDNWCLGTSAALSEIERLSRETEPTTI